MVLPRRNDEAIYVLDGAGTVRCPDGKNAVEPGGLPRVPVGPCGAHQIVNDSDHSLRYLVFSTKNDPDVTRYVEADAFGVYEGSAPGSHEECEYTGYFLASDSMDYWEEIDGRGRKHEEDRF